jgi:long-chain acyl-CoA synthetase
MVSHKALLSEVNIMEAVDLYIKDDDVYLSFLPFAHIMERLILALLISYGREIGFYSGSTMRLMEDAGILKPTLMASVPRVFQRVYEGINLKVDKLSPFERALFRKGVSQKLKDYATYGVLTNVFWDSLVFNKIRKLLGGRMRFMLTGAAPMSAEMLTFLKVVLCCQISEGYGQTEDCAGMLISNAYDRVAGHVGGPGFANEVKLVDVPELDYYTNSAEPKGEICIRGPVLFNGYLNDSERTKEVVDSEGWLHTGDVGVMLTHHGNAIRVIDRVKNIFKLQQGEYIAPEKLENVLIRSLWVSQLFVYGSSMENYLVAVVVPRTEKVVEYFNNKGETCSKDNVKEKYKDVALRKQIVKDLETLGRENDFKGFEVVKKVYLCPYEFTIENDLVGPTLKVKRHVAARHFKKEIEELYKENI